MVKPGVNQSNQVIAAGLQPAPPDSTPWRVSLYNAHSSLGPDFVSGIAPIPRILLAEISEGNGVPFDGQTLHLPALLNTTNNVTVRYAIITGFSTKTGVHLFVRKRRCLRCRLWKLHPTARLTGLPTLWDDQSWHRLTFSSPVFKHISACTFQARPAFVP